MQDLVMIYILEALLLHLILPLILRLIDVPPDIFAQPVKHDSLV
jgi:hypothetical protein